MPNLKSLAAEYRLTAAQMALWLEERGDGMSRERRAALQRTLSDIRKLAQLMDGYYSSSKRPYGEYIFTGTLGQGKPRG